MDETLVTLARFDWLMAANLARCRLESCGIEVYLAEEDTVSLCWHYARLLGGVRLQVNSADAEDALAVLAEEPLAIEEPTSRVRERITERALLTAVFGFFAWPLNLYAIWLLLPVFRWQGPVSVAESRNIVRATALLAIPFLELMVIAPGIRARF